MKFTEARRFPIVINLICFFIALTVAAVLLLKPLHAVTRGFFCDDDSIRYPYRPNTVSVPLLVVTAFVPAVLIVMALELSYGVLTVKYANAKENGGIAGVGASPSSSSSSSSSSGGALGPNSPTPVPAATFADRPWVEGLRSGLGRGGVLTACLFYGNCLCYSLTEIFKLSFGTLRPSFLAACRPRPDVTAWPNCTAGSHWYVEGVVCQNPDEELMIDMRKSFLSGHASFAVFNVFFIILYLQRRLPVSTPRLLVSLLQSVATGYAVFVCASRIYDNYHHPPDVVGGAVLGVLSCWVTMFKICPSVIRHPPRTHLDLLPTQCPKTVAPLPPAQGPNKGTALPLTSVLTKE